MYPAPPWIFDMFKRPPLHIDDFVEKSDCSYFGPIKWYNVNYYSKDVTHSLVGRITYNLESGQIGYFVINSPDNRGRGLGKQILSKAIRHIKQEDKHNGEIFTHTSMGHPFWSNVYNGKFKCRSGLIVGHEYYFKID